MNLVNLQRYMDTNKVDLPARYWFTTPGRAETQADKSSKRSNEAQLPAGAAEASRWIIADAKQAQLHKEGVQRTFCCRTAGQTFPVVDRTAESRRSGTLMRLTTVTRKDLPCFVNVVVYMD